MGWLQSALARFGGGASAARTPASAPGGSLPDWRTMGNAALQAGDLAEAGRCYAQGVAAQPDDPILRLNLGYVLLEQGHAAAAAEGLERSLALRRPADDFAHEAQFLLGRAYAGLGRMPEALSQFDAAARTKAGFVEPLEEAARLLGRLQRHAEALEWAQRRHAAGPSAASALFLAEHLSAAGRAEDALGLLDSLCASEPHSIDASVRRFDALFMLGRFPEALAEAERTLALTGPHPGALANAAAVLEKLGRVDDALARLDDALHLEPTHRGALVSRVAFLTQALRLPEAIGVAREALRHHPGDADLHWNLALAHLLRGEFEEGWRQHEWRLKVPSLRHKVLQVDAPPWGGENLAGRSILLHGEQGFGDNIQFARLVPQVAAQAGTVILRVDAVLQPLLRELLAPNCRLLAPGAALPRVDCHAPLMSLPALVGFVPGAAPAAARYLHPDPVAVRAWRERLGAMTGLKVGIAWSGNAAHANDHNRSIPLETFSALAVPGCTFVTVQPQLREGDREGLAGWDHARDFGRELGDFAGTAALIEALDLVVTVDTAVAHLAGALGKPVWVLLAYAPDWRWLLDREDSPWYPTARLYRQPSAGDWAGVIARLHQDLAALARERSQP